MSRPLQVRQQKMHGTLLRTRQQNNLRLNTMVHFAAGILPITFVDGSPLFLVGKDIRDGYSDFGGKCERVDRGNPMQTAAREFYEETLGTVVSAKALLHTMNSPGSCITLKSSTQNNYDYYMFIVEIPYLPHLRSSFRKVLKFLQSMAVQRLYVEKTDVQYVTWDLLQKMNKRPVFENTLALHQGVMEALASSSPQNWRSKLTTSNHQH